MKEKIYIDFGFAEHVQHGLTLVLQPQQLLDVDHDLLHLLKLTKGLQFVDR